MQPALYSLTICNLTNMGQRTSFAPSGDYRSAEIELDNLGVNGGLSVSHELLVGPGPRFGGRKLFHVEQLHLNSLESIGCNQGNRLQTVVLQAPSFLELLPQKLFLVEHLHLNSL